MAGNGNVRCGIEPIYIGAATGRRERAAATADATGGSHGQRWAAPGHPQHFELHVASFAALHALSKIGETVQAILVEPPDVAPPAAVQARRVMP